MSEEVRSEHVTDAWGDSFDLVVAGTGVAALASAVAGADATACESAGPPAARTASAVGGITCSVRIPPSPRTAIAPGSVALTRPTHPTQTTVRGMVAPVPIAKENAGRLTTVQ